MNKLQHLRHSLTLSSERFYIHTARICLNSLVYATGSAKTDLGHKN